MREDLELAQNPSTSPEKLIEILLKNKENDAVLSAIALHPNMTKELLIELIRNDDPCGENEEKKYFTDYFCLTDQNPVIELLLLEQPNLLEDIYDACFDELPGIFDTETFIFDDSIPYGAYLSFWYGLPDWFMKNAVKHKNIGLRIFVAGRVGEASEQTKPYVEQLLKDESYEVRQAMACSHYNTDSVLEKLVEDEHEEVRRGLAENKETPVSALLKLAQDKDPDVRLAVARSEHTPTSVLEKLLEDEDWEVRKTAARNKSISASGKS